jgi:hypothetical protein
MKIRIPTGAHELLRYFEDLTARNPSAHYQHGVAMCLRWIELIDKGASQSDITGYLSQLKSELEPGTGWIDLGLQFKSWARASGFVIDKEGPN